MKIINPWYQAYRGSGAKHYEAKNLVHTDGDFRVFLMGNKSYLYTYKNVAISHLGKLDRELVTRVKNSDRPKGKYSPDTFFYDCMNEAYNAALEHPELEKEFKFTD